MCGIVGYIGQKNTVDILFTGLRRLEYRGYDSAGISVLHDNKIWVEKAKGKLANLEKYLQNLPQESKVGIGHTRWATHGSPSQENAHPHQAGDVVLIHNGIIENFFELKSELLKEGAIFQSETDSEVIAHLLAKEVLQSTDLKAAFMKVLHKLEGAYALGVLFRQSPDQLFVAKSGSPLVIGMGEDENFFASDAAAFSEEAKQAIFLNDDEWGIISRERVDCFDFTGKKINPTPTVLNWNRASVEKQGYRHFMLKEIHEQPTIVSETIKRLIDLNNYTLNESELGFNNLDWERINAIKIIACGTAYLSGVVSQYFLEPLLRIPVTVEQASEFRYRKPYLDTGTLVVSISQSGETADTLASVKHSASLGCQTFSVCNTLHAAIPRASSSFLYMDAGQEIGVASTKAFVSQILCLYLWGMCFARKKALMDENELKAVVTELKRLPQYLDSAINEKEKIRELSKNYYESLNFIYIGRGLSYPLALEGALKLKEISYIHAEGYSAGELKHGPIALIDKHMPVVALVPRDRYFEKTVSNIQEIVAREGRIIAISDSLGDKLKNICDHHIYCPSSTNEVIQAILTAVPIQLFAYYIAVHRGTDVDQPRNLAKSVTVE